MEGLARYFKPIDIFEPGTLEIHDFVLFVLFVWGFPVVVDVSLFILCFCLRVS